MNCELLNDGIVKFPQQSNRRDTSIPDTAYRQFIELKIANLFSDSSKTEDLAPQDKIKVCQETMKNFWIEKDVVAIIVPIRFRKLIEERESVTLEKICLFNINLSSDFQKSLQSSLKISPELMKGVEGSCNVIFDKDRFRFNFLEVVGKETSTISDFNGDNCDNPIIWDIDSDRIEYLRNMPLTEETILTKYGNRPIVCSIFNATQPQFDYLSREMNKRFIETPFLKAEEKKRDDSEKLKE
jgi:hypothetical protein